MPIKKHAGLKALKQSKKRAVKNQKIKQGLRTFEKKFRSLLEAKDIKQLQEMIPALHKIFDKAAEKRVIKKNKARRKKSRLMGLLHTASPK